MRNNYSTQEAKMSICERNAEILDTNAAAKYLGFQPQTLAIWRTTGRYDLPYLKCGRLVRYRRADLDAWLASRRRTHTGESEA